MTGHECPLPEQIALCAGGDLTAAEAALLNEHMAGCQLCKVLYDELTADGLLLRAEPAIPEVTLQLVRSVVLSRTRYAGPSQWLPVAAGLVIALLGAGLWFA